MTTTRAQGDRDAAPPAETQPVGRFATTQPVGHLTETVQAVDLDGEERSHDRPKSDLEAARIELGPDAARFEIRRLLGAGGFGTVYEAFDRKRDAHVALKTMRQYDGRSLYQFKQEFRSLSELVHPNLVQLYELSGDGEHWFFTMELLRGQDAHEYVQATPAEEPLSTSQHVSPMALEITTSRTSSTMPLRAAPSAETPPRPSAPSTFDEQRLRSVFRQLASALCFLHDAGCLHRDIKPSNVMVTHDGRVVVLDFGLVVEIADEGEQTTAAGTPHYMAPEQAMSDAIGPAADWYAVGVMLYQALTGRLPFDGSGLHVLHQKLMTDPRPPSESVVGVPEDSDRLCMELLKRTPALRPSGKDVLERLQRDEADAVDGGERDRAVTVGETSRTPADEEAKRHTVFIGRASQLRELRAAFDTARAGRTAVALVHGKSGMGKSALVARFLDELRATEPDLVVLTGRCYEQESVPYKALDGLVDALARRLGRMTEPEVQGILPRDIATLSRLFPVLGRVPGVASARRRVEGADQLTLQRRAFAALRELLARLGDRGKLALFVDDLQWGDADSGALLGDLLRPPDAPVMLVVLAYRTDDATRSECLRALLPTLKEGGAGSLGLSEIAVDALGEDEARELARSELAGRAPARALEGSAATIASESGGGPLFIRELCRFSGALGEARPSLEAMLSTRVAALPDGARRLLEVVSVAGQPIERRAAVWAAELGDGGPQVLGLLRRERFLRVEGDRSRDEIATYHDRIRETVLGRLVPNAKRGHHLALAKALLATGVADEETLAVHFDAGGDPATAVEHAVKAADHALDALGFDRAARLYRQAIASIGEGDPRRRALHENLGVALGNAQRGPEAAAAYLVAAEGAGAAQALELRRRAAEHYYISGQFEKGLPVLRAVLGATGLSMPDTSSAAILRMLPLFATLSLRGLRFRERSESEIPAPDLVRIDACAAVACGRNNYAKPLVSIYFQELFLRLSLRAGEPHRILRALIYEATLRATRGHEVPSPFEEELHQRAVALTERLGDPGIHLWIGRGQVLILRGRLREGRELLERAEAALEESGAALDRDVVFSRAYLIGALMGLGQWKELRRRQEAFVDDARARGDLWTEAVLLSMFGYVPGLMADDPAAGRAVVERAAALWPSRDDYQRLRRAMALAATEHYRHEGACESGLALIEECLRGREVSRIVKFNSLLRVECHTLRGNALLAAAAVAAPGRRLDLLREVEREARALQRGETKPGPWASRFLLAGAAASRGDRARACTLLAEAEAGFIAIDWAMTARAGRRRRGELLGGDEGRALVASADAEMAAEDVRSPARVTAMYLPGRW